MDRPATGFEFLRRCCVQALRGEKYGQAGEPGLVLTDRELALAERHRVVPLFAAGWTRSEDSTGSDAGVRATLHRRVLSLAQQTVRLEQELGRMGEVLSSAGVEFMLLKGPALARQAYPVPEWRVYDDLDCWVESRDLDSALHALETAGYPRKFPLSPRAAACARRAGIEVALVHPRHGRLIEIAHGRAALAPSAGAAKEVLGALAEIDIGGVRVRTPAPVHALLLACAHGAHHRWDRLSWVADVAGLWSRLSSSGRQVACATARRWRVETELGLGLKLAADHLDVPLEGAAAALAQSTRVQALAARVELEGITPESLRVPMLERLRFQNDAQDCISRRIRAIAGWLFVPTMGDIEAVALPVPLFFLYAGIRPLRLLRHPWLREWRRLFSR